MPFNPESLIFPFGIDYNIQNCNFSCFVLLCNLVFDDEGRI